MFTSSFVEKNQETIKIDPKSEIIQSQESVESALEFIYTNNISNPSLELMMDVCKVAQLWIVENLTKLCEYFLAASLSFDNCEILLDFSKRNDCRILYNSSLRFILANLDEIAISKEGIFDPESPLFKEMKSLDILLPNDIEPEPVNKAAKEAKTFVVFRKSKLDQYIFSGNLAKLEFQIDNDLSHPVGLAYKISDLGLKVSSTSDYLV